MTDLRTDRLVLHPMTPCEARRVVAATAGETDLWGPEYPDAMDVKDAAGLLSACAAGDDPMPFGSFEIRRREDGRAVGASGSTARPGGATPDIMTAGFGSGPISTGATNAARSLRG